MRSAFSSNWVLLAFIASFCSVADSNTLRWQFEKDGCVSKDGQGGSYSEILWQSSSCWLDIVSGTGSLPGPDDDVEFDIGSFRGSAFDRFWSYLVVVIQENVNIRIRKFTVLNTGLSSLNCTSTWPSRHTFTMSSGNVPFFTLKIKPNGALSAESFNTITSCVQYFSLQIFEFGQLNLRADSLIDTLVLNWGSMSADRRGIRFCVFILEAVQVKAKKIHCQLWAARKP